MRYEDLKVNLEKEILPFYLINGGESFLTTSALFLIENALKLSMPEFNKIIFSFDTSKSAQDIVEACQVLPIFDKKRLVVVHDFLGKKNESEKKIFENYFKNPCPSTCLIFFSTQSSDFFSSFNGEIESVDCQKTSNGFLTKWILQKIKDKDFEIEGKALTKLMDFCNFSITKIDVELEKLFSIKLKTKNILDIDIDENVNQNIEYIIFDLTNAICQKDKEKAFLLIDEMQKNKENATNIISIISNHFRRLFFVARADLSNKELSNLLNIKEFAVIKYKQQAKNFSQLRLKEIYDLCLEVEYLAKSGGMIATNAIVYLIGSVLK